MKAPELISNYRALGPQPLNVILQYIADHFHQLRTRTGHKLFTVEDTKDFLEEAAGVAAKDWPLDELVEVSPRLELQAIPKSLPPAPQQRWIPPSCPDCDHEHEPGKECGHYLGEGKFCQCESRVTA